MLGSKAIANQSINIPSSRKVRSSSLKRRYAPRGKSVLCSPHVRRVTTNAALYDLAASGDILDTLFVSGISLSIALNIGVSAIPLLVGAQDAKKLRKAIEDDTEDIKWGVMSLLSFFPLLNWLAWVFGALDDEDRAPIYWTNALVYLLPWLSRGFELDRFSIACLVAGVIHIQVERVAQTEPESFQLPSPDAFKVPLQQAAKALTATARTYEETLEEAVETVEEKLLSDQQSSEQEEDRVAEVLRRKQLQAWDDKLNRDPQKEIDDG